MFFSYTASVVLLALALYGVWQIVRDVQEWLVAPQRTVWPSMSIVLYVRDAEAVVEDLLASILKEIDKEAEAVDLLLIDGGSQDLTLPILERMTAEREEARVVALNEAFRSAHDLLPLCRGDSIHFFDLVNRTQPSDCFSLVHRLLALHHRRLW